MKLIFVDASSECGNGCKMSVFLIFIAGYILYKITKKCFNLAYIEGLKFQSFAIGSFWILSIISWIIYTIILSVVLYDAWDSKSELDKQTTSIWMFMLVVIGVAIYVISQIEDKLNNEIDQLKVRLYKAEKKIYLDMD